MSLCKNCPRATEANHRPVKRGGKNTIHPSLSAVTLRTSMVIVASIPMKILRMLKMDIPLTSPLTALPVLSFRSCVGSQFVSTHHCQSTEHLKPTSVSPRVAVIQNRSTRQVCDNWMFQYNCPASSLRSEEHTSELQSRRDLVCRLLLEKKKKQVQNS